MSCKLKSKCGGCFYIDTTYENQILEKEKKVLSLINNIALYDYTYDGIIKSPLECEYRNKMELTFGDCKKDGPLTLGMHQKKSFYNILNANECELIDETMRKIIDITIKYFETKNISYYHKKTHNGYLRHLIIRKSFYNKQYMINLVTSTNLLYKNKIEKFDEKQILAEYIKIILDNFNNTIDINIFHTKNDLYADAVINEGIELLYGKNYIVEKLLNKNFIISPFSFFQTNTYGCEKLYQKVIEYIPENIELLYDMFCGTGTIGILASSKAKNVFGVEIIKEAIDNAKENAKINNIKNIDFLAEDVNILVKKSDLKKPNVIILDPPRCGVAMNSLESIIAYNAKYIIYVSCKIESFIENYKMLEANKYKIENVSIVDMFPHTNNIETIIKLKKIQ